MVLIKEAEDIEEYLDRKLIIWGCGNYGQKLEIMLKSRYENICICFHDENMKYENLRSYISWDEIKNAADNNEKMFIAIAMKNDDAAVSIEDKLTSLRNCVVGRYCDAPFNADEVNRKLCHDKNVLNVSEASELMKSRIESGEPFMFCRWGFEEGSIVVKRSIKNLELQTKQTKQFAADRLMKHAGVFPADENIINDFFTEQSEAAMQADILVKWGHLLGEGMLEKKYSPKAVLVRSGAAFPFWLENPWTAALKNKRVLVVHPFAWLIQEQYKKREYLFANGDILPEFDLYVYKAVQSMGGNKEYSSWVEALEKMKSDIAMIDFDIALIGCGAYGMPLAGFIKKHLNRQAVHVGGVLQMFFGIKGKRWETEYKASGYDWDKRLYNEYWVRPGEEGRPQNWKDVEGGCYW